MKRTPMKRKRPRRAKTGDKTYLEWVHNWPCWVCGRRPVHAHHDRKGMGMSQRAPDRRAIPLCAEHHTDGPEAIHKMSRQAFEEWHKLSIDAVIQFLNTVYDDDREIQAGRAQV